MERLIRGSLFAGFVSVLFLAGCFNPVAVESPVSRGKPSPSAPFSVEIELDGESVSVRSLYGAARTALPGAGGSMSLINNYANFSQLVVVDGTDGSIFYAAEVRRQKDEKDAVFKVPPVNLDRSQLFLLLMGHLADGEESPTLLAAGFSNRLVDDERKVLLYMWPIQVDTELNSSLEKAQGKEPVEYKNGERLFDLWPAKCEMKWTLKTEGGIDPLSALIAAQEVIASVKKGGAVPETPAQGIWDGDYSSVLHSLKVKDAVIKTSGQRKPGESDYDWADTLSLTAEGGVRNVISWDMSDYTWGSVNQLNRGSVNFNLEYVPFNLTDPAAWRKWDGDSEFTLGGGSLPVWIIRNGINDAAQDGATDFDRPPGAGANGNGAAAFVVKHRYWSAHLDNNGNYEGPAPGVDAWGMSNSSFQYGGQSSPGILVSVSSVWDSYNGRFLTREEASGVVEIEIDWGKVTYVESYPNNYEELLKPVPDDLVGGLRFVWDDNKQEQRLVRVIDGGCTWNVYVKGTLRKGIKGTAEDWTGTSSFILKW